MHIFTWMLAGGTLHDGDWGLWYGVQIDIVLIIDDGG